MMHIVIPAAGAGRRFVEAGYPSKAMADVLGVPMLQRVVDNVRGLVASGMYRVTVVTTDGIAVEGAEVVRLDAPTRGAVETILAADIRDGERLLVANCDQLVQIVQPFIPVPADGLVLTFRSSKPHHSYVRVTDEGFIAEIVEKRVISRNAVAGVYYFENGARFRAAAEKVLADDRRVLGEFYVSTVLDEILSGGAKLQAVDSQVAILGTPEELDLFVMAARVAAQVSADKLRKFIVNGATPESVVLS